MSSVITVENLGKKYILSHQQREQYTALRDVIANGVTAFSRWIAASLRRPNSSAAGHRLSQSEDFWALQDVSFEVRQGDRVGIIGHNGAGKSTLLKILSRITEPTTGSVRIKGRVASLLEVGTGFHPELTGRENIYLNGAILGMSRFEIKRNFDEIVAFAEIEKFLDTPVKRYSSGMYVRLAFAVAAHLEPEILVVDEVLAVGDAQFQKKCLGKMEDVSAKEGRTVLFVSHNMNAVEQLCSKALLLEKGRVKQFGNDVRPVVTDYLFNMDGGSNSSEWINSDDSFENDYFMPFRFSLLDANGNAAVMPLKNDSDTWIQIEGAVKISDQALTVGYAIYNEDGNLLYWSYQTDVAEAEWQEMVIGYNVLRSKIPTRLLNDGTYRLELISSLHYRQWLCEPGVNAPSIYLTIQGGLSDSPYWMVKRPGILAPVVKWDLSSK